MAQAIAIAHARDALAACRRLVVISGAGISTASGIPDYRSPGRPPYKPMQHADFVNKAHVRQRYWARSFLGFVKIGQTAPNSSHKVLTRLEQHGRLGHIITQNVDELHQIAGSVNVLALHGTIRRVRCLACFATKSRVEFQRELLAHNPHLLDPSTHRSSYAGLVRPDGDMDVDEQFVAGFAVPPCSVCGGALTPDVVFYGGSLSEAVTKASYEIVESADAVLALGTTFQVWSAFRLMKLAVQRPGSTVVVCNLGVTRADSLPGVLKLDMPIDTALEHLFPNV